jgi:lysophospholipase L1-like esterase
LLLALTCCAGCNKTPSAPTPVAPPPPVAEPPSLTCPAAITATAPSGGTATVTYTTPEIRNGQGSVTVTCTPQSGATFPIGVTETSCVATDVLNRTGTCTFAVTVVARPRLSRTRIMAFGDSLTSGTTILGNDPYMFSYPPDVPYPFVLGQLLTARYTDQAITVLNRGLPGEQAFRALPRFTAALAADAPEVVVLHEGYNDYNVSTNDLTGILNAEAGIRAMAGEARRRGVRVFICLLAPARPGGRLALPFAVLYEINERLKNVARQEGAVVIDLYSALSTDINGNVTIDGLHLTPLGYKRVAETVFAALRAELEVR